MLLPQRQRLNECLSSPREPDVVFTPPKGPLIRLYAAIRISADAFHELGNAVLRCEISTCRYLQGGADEHIAEARQTCNTNHPKSHFQSGHTKKSFKSGLEGGNRATFGYFNFFCPINVCCAITCQSLQKAFY